MTSLYKVDNGPDWIKGCFSGVGWKSGNWYLEKVQGNYNTRPQSQM